MTERQTIAARAAQQLRNFAASAADVQVLLGFDGFVDSIIQVVDKRHDGEHYDAIPLIETFGQRIVEQPFDAGEVLRIDDLGNVFLPDAAVLRVQILLDGGAMNSTL